MVELVADVIGIRRAFIVRLVAAITLRRRPLELPVDVALRTTRVYMRSRQREIRTVVIEAGGRPGDGCMALRTRMTEVSRHVVRVLYAFEVRLMAGPAICRRSRILSVDVASLATGG